MMKPIEPRPRAHEHLLREVVGGRRVDMHQEQPVDHTTEMSVKPPKGRSLPSLSRLDVLQPSRRRVPVSLKFIHFTNLREKA